MNENDIVVRTNVDSSAATLEFQAKSYNVVIGKNGAVSESEKAEGDWKTPLGGPYGLLKVYYRQDKVTDVDTALPCSVIKPDDVWVDDVTSPLYNQPAKVKDVAGISHEELYRNDHLYDIFVDVSFNRENIVPGKGSAIFIHLSRDQETPANTPTAGCIAMRKQDLSEMLRKATPQTRQYII